MAVQRFARIGEWLGSCECGSDLTAGAAGWRSVLPAADLRDCWDRPLADLGIQPGAALGFAEADDWTYVFFAEAEEEQAIVGWDQLAPASAGPPQAANHH